MSRDGDHLVLVGLMGAGKSEVGRRCAARLERSFVDTDALVEAAAGVPIAQIFATEGETGFRAREARAVADACAAPDPSVISCGGGAVLDAANRRLLGANGFVVWLTAPAPTLAERVKGDDTRPLLAGADPEGELARLVGLREPAYREVADVTVDTDGRSPDAVATEVVGLFEGSEARA